MNQKLLFTHVTERDMDLIVVEELKCSPAFRHWLYAQFAQPAVVKVLTSTSARTEVSHSVSRTGAGSGETDIQVRVRFDGGAGPKTFLLLIEDKIDSPFTPTQCERYQQAASHAKSSGAADGVTCLLVCPASYCQGNAGFDAKVTYEQMAQFFESQVGLAPEELQGRYKHRIEMIQHALGKFRRGYQSVPDPVNSNFWREYYLRASEIALELAMPDPGNKPTYSIDVYLKAALPPVSGLRKAWLLKHSLENGAAMIEISQWGIRFAELEPLLAAAIDPDMVLKCAGKSIQVRLKVPNLNTNAPFQQQRDAATQGILAMKRLRTWYLGHATLVGECQQIAESG